MPYLLKLKDITVGFDTKASRDQAYASLKTALAGVGIPADEIHLDQVDTRVSDFSGRTEEKVVGGTEHDRQAARLAAE